jgi:hypothetical protein
MPTLRLLGGLGPDACFVVCLPANGVFSLGEPSQDDWHGGAGAYGPRSADLKEHGGFVADVGTHLVTPEW